MASKQIRCVKCKREFTARGFSRHHCNQSVVSVNATSDEIESTPLAPPLVDVTAGEEGNELILEEPHISDSIAENHILQLPVALIQNDPVPAAPDPSENAVINHTEPASIATDSSNFNWGDCSGYRFTKNLEDIYEQVVFFRQNLFKLPSGSAGKEFIREITRLVKAWNSNSILVDIAWKCIMVMPALLLQKPSKLSKSKDHTEALKRRLVLWKKGNLHELLRESETIQSRLKSSTPSNSIEAVSKKFANLMKKGKLNAAIKLLPTNM